MLNFEKHLNELKYRTLYISLSFLLTFITCYTKVQIIIYFFTLPLLNTKKVNCLLNQYDFIFTNIFEAFSSYTFISFITTLYLTLPIFLYLFFSFIKLGLLRYEKKYINFIINLILISCFCSIIFTFKFFLPLVLKFFISFENLAKTNLFTLKLEPKILDYLYLTVIFSIWSTLIFQIPVLLLLLLQQTFVNFAIFEKNRKFVFITFVILGGIFSPPEIFAQLIIALPLCLFFEVVLFFAYLKNYYTRYY